MKLDLSSKRGKAAFALITLAFAAWVGFAFVDFVQVQRTRDVFTAIGKANDERKQKGESIAAAEAYVAALRRIDLRYAKKELRPAVVAYVAGFEEGLALSKAGADTGKADAKLTAAHRKLVEIAERYE